MSSKTKFDVFLTSQALEQLKDSNILKMLIDGRYFLCDSIDSTGVYFFMKLQSAFPIQGHEIFEVSIPHSFVLYILSFDTSTHPSL